MDLQDIICIILIIGSAVCGTIAFDYKKTQSNYRNMVQSIMVLGVAACWWSFSSAAIYFSNTIELAVIFRGILILSIDVFMLAEVYLVSKMEDLNKRYSLIVNISGAVLGLADFIIFGCAGIYKYAFNEHGRILYVTDGDSLNFKFHIFYMGSMVVMFLFMYFKWRTNIVLKRQRILMFKAIAANVWILFMAMLNTVAIYGDTPLVGISAFGGIIAFMIIAGSCFEFQTSVINIRNLSNQIFNSAETGIVIFDIEGAIRDANPYAEKLLNIDVSNGVTLYGREVFKMPEADVNSIYSEKNKNIVDRTFRWEVLRSDTVCSVKPVVVRDSHGEPVCIICSVYDLTEEEKMRRDVMAASKAKSSFLANMSHEIRTPINAVLGMNEMILRESTEKPVREYAADIEDAGKALLSLVNDILDFSKIETGKMDIVPVEYNLANVLRNPIEMVKIRAAEKSLLLNVKVDENMPSKLYGDEMRIRQIMTNLLNNAVKYTKAGSVTVSAKCERVNGDNVTLVYSVRDTGIGIKEENIPKLFTTSFQRLDEKKNRNIEGTGLGLSITKQLVELMGGSIGVESTYGEGSLFIVRIPQVVRDFTPMGPLVKKEEPEKIREDKEEFTAPTARVLAVDDVPANLKVFKFLLKKSQIKVDTANGGAEAVQKAIENKYDLIFMDHMMPEMDGIEATQKIKDLDNSNSKVPIIMLTANAITGAREEYLESGFADYLSKPVIPEELDKILRKYLN